MKNLIASLVLVLFTAACSQTGSQPSAMMQNGAMCEKCACCQKMMESGMMKDGKMQCPMMQGQAKGGETCSCCQMMMEGSTAQKQPAKRASTKPAGVSEEDHEKHHPAQ